MWDERDRSIVGFHVVVRIVLLAVTVVQCSSTLYVVNI